MTMSEGAAFTFLVRLAPGDRKSDVALLVSSAAEDCHLATDGAEFVVRIWWEGPDVVRASIANLRSGVVAMVQGNAALRRRADDAPLRLTRD